MSIKRNVTIDLPNSVYRRLLRSAARNGWTLAKEIEHLILRQFDRNYSQAEFDKLVREIRQGSEKD
jgi:macrodomain Ter protein organizer (MatP/YcbG family)